MKTVICYGDSNTWGMTPMHTLDDRDRLDIHTRWAGVLRDTLGADYWVVEEGLNGRTTVWQDPIAPDCNGATYLTPCLLTHSPIDLVILMLGTNDLKHRFGKSPYDIASGAGFLVETILRSECGTRCWNAGSSAPVPAADGCPAADFRWYVRGSLREITPACTPISCGSRSVWGGFSQCGRSDRFQRGRRHSFRCRPTSETGAGGGAKGSDNPGVEVCLACKIPLVSTG